MTSPLFGIQFSDADRYIRLALDGLAARQRAISNNVANVDTPRFKASDVPFERVLQDAVRQHGFGRAATDPTLRAMALRPEQTRDTSLRADGNNVDVDREMVQLADATLRFGALAQAMSSRLSILRDIATDGRR